MVWLDHPFVFRLCKLLWLYTLPVSRDLKIAIIRYGWLRQEKARESKRESR